MESDPYAFLTVLNLNVHKDHPSIKALVNYLLSKSSANPRARTLHDLIGQDALSSSQHVGLLLGERMVNMPPQIIPPMYRMLQDEIKWANDDKESYIFEHYIVLSRLYKLTKDDVSMMMDGVEESAPPPKKQKKKAKAAKSKSNSQLGPLAPGTFPFHPEDETIQKIATLSLDYDFSNRQPKEGPESLGLELAGRLMVFPSSRFPEMVESLSEAYPVPGS